MLRFVQIAIQVAADVSRWWTLAFRSTRSINAENLFTRFLLRWTWDEELRHAVHKGTTKVERNHQFSKFLNFGGEGGLKTNNPADQEKAIVYNELVANAVAAQTVNDLTHALNKLHDRGINIAAEYLAHFSPYPTSKVKRFGDYPAQVIIDDRPIQKHLPVSSVSMAAL